MKWEQRLGISLYSTCDRSMPKREPTAFSYTLLFSPTVLRHALENHIGSILSKPQMPKQIWTEKLLCDMYVYLFNRNCNWDTLSNWTQTSLKRKACVFALFFLNSIFMHQCTYLPLWSGGMEDIFEIGILKWDYSDISWTWRSFQESQLLSLSHTIDENNTVHNLFLSSKYLLSPNQLPNSGQKCVCHSICL